MTGPRGQEDVWRAVDRLVDRSRRPSDLQAHGLDLLAARLYRSRGRPVPEEFAEDERRAALVTATAPLLLEVVRAAWEGPLVLIKGPELASYYPDASLRLYKDLDLLAPDAREAQRALLRAGFIEVGKEELYRGIHHLRPLRWKAFPLEIELHERPKWIDGLVAPTFDELRAAAVPSRVAVEGIWTLPPAHHAVVLAAHSWAHAPLRRVLDLLDVTVLGADDTEADALARSWGLGRLWATTRRASDALFVAGPRPLSVRLWGRHLVEVRERTVLERHLARTFSPFWELAPATAFRASVSALYEDLTPLPDEPWPSKLRRALRALRNARVRLREHDAADSPEADET